MEMQLQTKDTLATLHLDPRTKLYLLIVGNVALFLAPSLLYEIALVVCVVILGILVGAKRFTVRMAAVYAGMVVLHIIGTNYLTGTLQIAIVTFTVFIRKIFPCAMLGGIYGGHEPYSYAKSNGYPSDGHAPLFSYGA